MSALSGKAFNVKELKALTATVYSLIRSNLFLESDDITGDVMEYRAWKYAYPDIAALAIEANKLVTSGDQTNYGNRSPLWQSLDETLTPLMFSSDVRKAIDLLPAAIYEAPISPLAPPSLKVSRPFLPWKPAVAIAGIALAGYLTYNLLRRV